MATTAALAFAGNNRLRYLITDDAMGGTVTIPNDGGATPDLLTDSLPGPLKQIFQARTNGIGTIAPGALTQAQARALLLSDAQAANVGNSRVPRAICMWTPRAAGTAAEIDANVDGQGDPVVAVTVGAAEIGYLDIMIANGAGISAAG